MRTAPSLLPIRGLYESTTPGFRRKLQRIGESLGIDPNHIAAVMACESGFNPTQRNPDSRATGLIGFMPSTAKLLGTTVDELREMSAEQQLDYVAKYYGRFPWHSRLKTATQVYMATFTGEPFHSPDFVVFEWPSIGYRQNKVFDVNGDGAIQVWEVGSFPEGLIRAAKARVAKEADDSKNKDRPGAGRERRSLLPLALIGIFAVATLKGANHE